MRSENPGAVVSGALPRLEPLRSVRTDALEVAYFEAGPSDGEVEHLLHGSPYDIHSYVDVIPRLVEAGHRVIAPIRTNLRAIRPRRVRGVEPSWDASCGCSSDSLSACAAE